MLVLKILATVFVGISFITALIKNINVFQRNFDNRRKEDRYILISTLYGWIWRALVLTAIRIA